MSSLGGNFDVDAKKLTGKGAYAFEEAREEAASDNRLGGAASQFEKQISIEQRRMNGIPRDPRKKPRAYDSIWDIFN